MLGVPFPFVLILALLLAGVVDGMRGRSAEAAPGARMQEALAQVEGAYQGARSAIQDANGGGAEPALARLAQAWARFDARDGSALAQVPGEAERRAEIERLISTARAAVRSDPRQAAESLEQVGTRLRDLRARYGTATAESGR